MPPTLLRQYFSGSRSANRLAHASQRQVGTRLVEILLLDILEGLCAKHIQIRLAGLLGDGKGVDADHLDVSFDQLVEYVFGVGRLAGRHGGRQYFLGVDDDGTVGVQIGQVAHRLHHLESHLDVRRTGVNQWGINPLAVPELGGNRAAPLGHAMDLALFDVIARLQQGGGGVSRTQFAQTPAAVRFGGQSESVQQRQVALAAAALVRPGLPRVARWATHFIFHGGFQA